jgi:tetratricopeptide (TPR) repeat protein
MTRQKLLPSEAHVMTEKIEWYKEVLELEPNSKVFFPLARLLKEENRCDESMDVLERGLERHPEFLEARLLFIEMLHKAGKRSPCAAQINKISAIFSGYAAFWQAWAACLAADGTSPDMSTVLRFMAAHFMHPPLSLHEVFDKGVTAILGQAAENPQPATAEPTEVAAEIVQQPPEGLSAKTSASSGDAPQPPALSSEAVDEPEQEAAEYRQADEAEVSIVEEPDEAEEHFSLRTRSMAEVLAEQGDIKGALDIYQELAAAATVPVEKADLLQRIATLNAKLVMAAAVPASQTASETEAAAEKTKLISKLEALAERVEARAHG